MSDQMNFKNLLNVTSSQGSASGVTRSDPQDGKTTDQSGQDRVRANLSAVQATEKGWLTSGTSGLTGFTSSKSADLQRSLESRLQAKTASVGSTLYKLTWKERTTPSGLSISALRASVRRTSGNVSGSWPTPTTRDGKGGYQGGRIRNGKISTDTLDVAAQLTGWPTPRANKVHPEITEENQEKLANRNKSNLEEVVAVLWGWATPTTADHKGAAKPESVKEWNTRGHNLPEQAQMSGWTTPSATDGTRGGIGDHGRNVGEQPDPVVEDGRVGNTQHDGQSTSSKQRSDDQDAPDDAKEQIVSVQSEGASVTRDDRSGDGSEGGGDTETHAHETNGFWSDADWLLCRDGKWRPVRTQTFPLVDGATARVGRLRAYGNAITAQVAQGLIESYMEVRDDAENKKSHKV